MEKRRYGKWLKAMLLTLAMTILCGLSAMAADVKTVNMEKGSSGVYTYVGSFASTDTTVYHKITVNKSGLLGVSALGRTGNYTHGVRVSLCNSKKKSLERVSAGTYVNIYASGLDSIAYYGVKKGTYYIKVSGESSYIVAAEFTEIADKGGKSKAKATNVKKGKTTYGVMPAGEKASKADWLKFKVTKKRVLELNLGAVGNGKFTFYLYGPSYKKGIKIDTIMNLDKSYQSIRSPYNTALKVRKGTYYLKVVRASGSNKKSSGAYYFNWSLR